MNEFDKTEYFKENCMPYLTALREKCHSLGIPFLYEVCLGASEKDGNKYIYEVYTDGLQQIPKQFQLHQSILNGMVIDLHPSIFQKENEFMSETKNTAFNFSRLFNKHCSLLLQRFTDVCTVGRVPMFFIALISLNKDGECSYQHDGLIPDGIAIKIRDDHFKRHLLVCAGFTTKPKPKILSVNIDEDTIVKEGDIEEFLLQEEDVLMEDDIPISET